ncbi:MAG: hypothetical protein RhofKO_02180 [Rhodothermales bacterium]
MRTLVLALFALCLGLPVQAQAPSATISGRVIDVETLEPLPGVNVFLDQTLLGAATDPQGRFEIKLIPLGSYSVVASALGFETTDMEVDAFVADTVYTVDLRMRAQVVDMAGVEVEGERSPEWWADYERFQDLFLGVTRRAKHAEIENPHVLSFNTEDGIFTAEAREPIRVRNEGLGYRVIFTLDIFHLDMNTDLLAMNGPFFFQELEPQNRREARRWRRNQRDVYEGSLAHVMATLVGGDLWNEPFQLFYDGRQDAPHATRPGRRISVAGHFTVSPAEQPYMHYISFPDYFRVVHDATKAWIKIDGPEALVHASGHIYAPRYSKSNVQVFGTLAARGVADLLPRYYGWAPDVP